ncbi:lipocalin-like domain-containing protein [Sphingobacterium siyangense]|uniref:Lipocalin-like protein n=1 Tax=Sphingobacterium siyangense TaxID=459529 RepID=A0A562MKG6_9SPHI|nr:lipocalin-like domain-containing protein [Sphingobacterium siyangense]TWI20328.1 lipocalin-like protein [Sphingobacterium siyangense]
MENIKLRDKLLGAWSLVSYEAKDESGNISYPMKNNCQGIIMYTADGYMSAQMMIPGRPAFKINDLSYATNEEFAAAASSYLAYSGPFYVDEDTQTLRHEMTISLFPNWLNQVQIRLVEIHGDKLHLGTEGPILINGKMQNTFLIWERKPFNN